MPAAEYKSSYDDDDNNRLAYEAMLKGLPDWFPVFTAPYDVTIMLYCEDQTKGIKFFCMGQRVAAGIDISGNYIDEHWKLDHVGVFAEPLLWTGCHPIPVIV